MVTSFALNFVALVPWAGSCEQEIRFLDWACEVSRFGLNRIDYHAHFCPRAFGQIADRSLGSALHRVSILWCVVDALCDMQTEGKPCDESVHRPCGHDDAL